MMNMDGNEREKSCSLTGKVCERYVGCEVSGDFTIPDSQPEARRILSLTERVLPPAKYVGSSAVECNGTIDYRVVYLGVDGALWGACFSSEYELEAPVEENAADTSGGVDTVVTVACEGSTSRLSAGRRLNIKSRISADIRAYGEADTELNTYGDVDEDSIEKRYLQARCADIISRSSDVMELSEEITGLSEDSRVISADACAFVSEVRKGGGRLIALGEVTLSLLVCREGQRAEVITKKLPFEEGVECDRSVADSLCRVVCRVTDITVNVGEGVASCSVSAVLSAVAARNIECSYVADIYSVERSCECEVTELCLPVVAVCSGGNFSQSERMPLADTGIPEGAQLVDIHGRVLFDSCAYSGRYELTGKSRYAVLWEKDGEYGSAEVELPVRYGIEGEEVADQRLSASADIISCRGRIDGELLCIDSEIAVSADIMGNENIRTVTAARFGEPFAKEKNRMVVYYPAENETPWDVAKKYHVRADSLAEEKNYYLF